MGYVCIRREWLPVILKGGDGPEIKVTRGAADCGTIGW
jgi:hypothetical protein